jgi:hypothetical protein
MSLSILNIESELSYAHLHAIAGKAAMNCKSGDRHNDGFGVDAEVNYRCVTSHPYLTHVQEIDAIVLYSIHYENAAYIKK